MSGRPRVLFVGRTRIRLPLDPSLTRRYEALSGELDWHQFGTSAGGADSRFTLVPVFPVRRLDGVVFYLLLAVRLVRLLRSFRPSVVIVQGAHETALALAARAVSGVRARVVLDVHGDWRTATRLYGSRHRDLLSPFADLLARISFRRADGIRTVSGFTSGLVRAMGREPDAEFPAFMDLEPFLATPPEPLPATPTALFVGVLERYKGVQTLAAAWPAVLREVPEARLEIVGRGPLAPLVQELVATSAGSVRWTEALDGAGVSQALDRATLLVLPSRTEGMGRVVVEALCRGRAVVGGDDGGIADLVTEASGCLVPPDAPDRLAAALVAILGEPERASALGRAAYDARGQWVATAAEFARRMRELVDTVASKP